MPTGPKRAKPAIDIICNWLSVKADAKRLTAEEKVFNAKVAEQVAKFGEVGENGHVWLYLDEPVVGWDSKGKPQKYNAIKRERRSSVVMDQEVAASILVHKRILDECSTSYIQVTDTEAAIAALEAAGLIDGKGFEVITELDEQKVRAHYFADEPNLTKAEYEQIFKETEPTWATIPYRV